MKQMRICIAIIWVVAGASILRTAAGDDAGVPPASSAQEITIKTCAAPNEKRDYNVDEVITGKMPVVDEPKPVDVDATLAVKIRHSYSPMGADNVQAMDMSLVEGHLTVQGQKLDVTPSLYPTLTILFDKDGRVTQVFGLPGSRPASSAPGISYSNMIMLFQWPGGSQARAVGQKWQSQVKAPGLDGTYDFANTLKRVDDIDGEKVAVVDQEISWDPKTSAGAARATTESSFAISDGKLVKSHVDCVVTFGKKSGGGQEETPPRANIKIDISLAK